MIAALILVWFSFEQVIGACSVKSIKEKYKESGETKEGTIKGCSKGCSVDYVNSDTKNDVYKCFKCKDVKALTDVSSSWTKEKVCKQMGPLSCTWKAGNCLPGSCPSIVVDQKQQLDDCKNHKGNWEDQKDTAEDCDKQVGTKQEFKENVQAVCKAYGCLYSKKNVRCSILSVWALIVIIIVAVVVVIAVVVIIILVIVCSGKKSATAVEPAPAAAPAPATKAPPQAAPAGDAAPAGPPPEVGPYVVLKLGKQELKTKKVESQVWGQDIVFTGLGAEDDDVVFELHDTSDALLGSADVRIPDYVNNKKRATINLKNGEADVGVLEVDIEIQVQEEPEVKITGVFFIDKLTPAA